VKLQKRKRRTAEHRIPGEDKKSVFRTLWGSSPARRLAGFILPVAVFCWPIFYLFRHIFLIHNEYLAIGNDFIVLYYKYKVYLLAHLCNFSFPLWSPSEGAGFPFYTNPFAQVFYPFNLLLAIWYKISGGYNPLDHQVFTVLGISIFALGLFAWLRLVNSNLRAVVFAALVMSVSFKMTEIIRFPNAVHTAAWYPWVLWALTKIMFSPSLKDAIRAGIALVFFMICLCTAGYPYYIYYSQFLFVPYLLIFLLKPLRARLFGRKQIKFTRALGTLAVAGAAVLLICGPYLLGVKNLMSETTDRAGKNFSYSTQHAFTFEDTAGSLVYPPAAQTEGWYFFSITGVLIILLYLFCGKVSAHSAEEDSNKEKVLPVSPEAGDWWVKGFFVIWIALISYISYGHSSYLFILLWKYLPGFSNLRVWGRINIILVPILAWLLSLAYSRFELMLSDKNIPAAKNLWRQLDTVIKAIAIYAVVLGAQLYFYHNKICDPYWLQYFDHLSPLRIWFIFCGAAAFIIILLLLISGKLIHLPPKAGLNHSRASPWSTRSLTVVLTALVVIATIEMWPVGAHTWTYQSKVQMDRIYLDVAKINEASFRFPRTDEKNSIPLGPNFNVGILDNWYFNRYVKFLKESEDQLEARRLLLGVRDGRKIFFSESIKYSTVQSFLRDALRYRDTGHLLSYTGDQLCWEINAPVKGCLSFIDNWDWGWKAFVDDKPSEINLLFGTFKSVAIAPGRHIIRFSYEPGIRVLFESTKRRVETTNESN
jgi:hypothetical protein